MSAFYCGAVALFTLIYVVYTRAEARLPATIDIPKVAETRYYKPKDNYSITCEGTGIPKPRFTWRKNGKQVIASNFVDISSDIEEGMSILTLIDASKRESGTYQCVAENKWGVSISQPITLMMIFIEKFEGNSDEITVVSVKKGDSASLTCDNSPVSVPTGTFQWYVGRSQQLSGTKRMTVDKFGTLHFMHTLEEDSDQEKYSCAVSNLEDDQIVIGSHKKITFSTGVSDTIRFQPIKLSVSDKTEANIGDTVTLQCIFGGFPVPKIKWFDLSGDPLTRNTSKYNIHNFARSLEIKRLIENDEGKYKCEAENPEGIASANLFLNVTSPPIPTNSLRSHHAIIGTTVTFFCQAKSAHTESSPSPPVWYIDGQMLNLTKEKENGRQLVLGNDRSSLTVQDVSRDTGLMGIQCNISNSVGFKFFDAFLNVLEPIAVTKRPDKAMEFQHGDVLDFSIHATTDPSRTLARRWFLNKEPLKLTQSYFMYNETSGELYFNSSKIEQEEIESMTGDYVCELFHDDQRVDVSFSISLSKPTTDRSVNPGNAVNASSNLTVIAIVCGVLVALIVVIAIVVVLKTKRYPKAEYKLGKKEDNNFNLTPIDQLETEELHNDTLNQSKLSLYDSRQGY